MGKRNPIPSNPKPSNPMAKKEPKTKPLEPRTLVTAAWRQDWSLCRTMLNQKVGRINATNHHGQTAFMAACFYQQHSLMKLMVRKGAKPDKSHKDGYSPLHDAARWNKVKTVQLLLELGADIHKLRDDGMSVFDFARESREGIRKSKKSIQQTLDVLEKYN